MQKATSLASIFIASALALMVPTTSSATQCPGGPPTVSASATAPDPETGEFQLTINYDAERVIFYWRSLQGFYEPAPQPGPVVADLTTDCLAPGIYELKVETHNCLGSTLRVARQTLSVTAPEHKPGIEASLRPGAGSGQLKLDLGYTYANTKALSVTGDWLPNEPGQPFYRAHDKITWYPVKSETHSVYRSRDQRKMLVTAIACGDTSINGRARKIVVAPDGESCPLPKGGDCPCLGGPINPYSGTMRFTDHDPLPGGTGGLVRIYDSANSSFTPGYFGRFWKTFLDGWMTAQTLSDGTNVAVLELGNDDTLLFERIGGTYVRLSNDGSGVGETLWQNGSLWIYRDTRAGREWRFDATHGRVVSIVDLSTGRSIDVTRNASGVPSRVADSWGNWAWNLTLTDGLVTRIDVENRPDLYWNYTYHGFNKTPLSVTGPGGNVWRTYVYGSGSYDNRLTEVRDTLGNLIEGHVYDIDGLATTSSLPGEEIVDIRYGLSGRVPDEQLTEAEFINGRIEKHYTRPVAGRRRTVQIEGGCASCGGGDQTRAFDAEGRATRVQGPRGWVTEYQYDRPNSSEPWVVRTHLRPDGCDPSIDPLMCRLDPDQLASTTLATTSESRTTTFIYGDTNWPERPTDIYESSALSPGSFKHENVTYHPTTGATLTSTTSGWTGIPAAEVTRTTTTALYDGTEGAAFDPGGAFSASWLSLAQPSNLRKSVDGPRSDVTDTTTFVYYPIDASVPATWRGRLAAVRNAAGHTTRYENYDVFGNAERVVDANGVVTESTHDSIGRVLTTTTKGVAGCNASVDPLCATDLTSSRTYMPALGPLASQTSAGGGASVNTYDTRGRVLTISRGPSVSDLRERIEYAYNASGKKSSERTLAYEGAAWVEKKREDFTYDSFERLSRSTHADNSYVEYTYDAGHNLESVQDENHVLPNTSYEYDPANRLTRVTQTLGAGEVVTTYAYDLHGNLTTVTDPNGNVTTYVYDDFGQMLSQTSPVTGVTTYTYDPSGSLLSTTDSRGAVTTRNYDEIGRVTQSVTSLGADTETVTWSYDSGTFGIGRLAAMTDPTGSTSYTYDRRGMLASETKTVNGTAFTTSFQYDEDGSRTRMVYPSGMSVDFSYDFADRPVFAGTATTTFVSSASYLPFGPITEVQYGNGTTKTVEHDTRYRPTLNRLNGPGGVIAQYAYQHDAAGNITAITDEADHGYDRTFGYDDLNRLVTANSGAKLWGTGSYSYDAMGNMLGLALGSERAGTFAYQGTTPKISTATENAAPRSVSYDVAGNETAVGAGSFTYTPRNSLASGDGLAYLYDGRGIRTITGIPNSLAMLSSDVNELDGGGSVNLTVTLNHPAPAGGAVVTLASDDPALTVPASVTIPEAQTSASVPVGTAAVAGRTRVEITGSYVLNQKAIVVLRPVPMLTGLTLGASETTGGFDVTGDVTVNQPAPANGLAVALSSNDPAVSVPASVIVPAGETSMVFVATASPVAASVTAQITATLSGTQQQSLTVLPPVVASLEAEPALVGSGLSLNLVVTLTGLAPSGGSSVALSASDTGVSLPASVLVPAGASSTNTVATMPVVGTELPVTFTAVFGGSAVASATVTTAVISDLVLADTSINSPAKTKGTVQLSGNAPSGGVSVSTSSSNTQAATTQTPVVAVEGTSSVEFEIATVIGQTTRTSTITAQSGSSSANEVLTVGPCQQPLYTPPPPPGPASEYIWFDDAPPPSTLGGLWVWDTTQFARGEKSHRQDPGTNHYLQDSQVRPLIGPDDSLIVYTLLDPCDPPKEVMIMWKEGAQTWNHRAFWGQDQLIGSNYSPRSRQGNLPTLGEWARLEVAASAIGMQNQKPFGISFITVGGRAWFDAPAFASCLRDPEPASPEPGDEIWFDDAVPAGAIYNAAEWSWVTDQKVSGTKSHYRNNPTTLAWHSFKDASDTMTVNPGDVFVVYALLKTCAATPRQIVIQWKQPGQCCQQVYWGDNMTGWEAIRMGDMPPAGQWVRLEVPASLLGLEGKTVAGMGFVVHSGQVWFDAVGKYNPSAKRKLQGLTDEVTPAETSELLPRSLPRAEGRAPSAEAICAGSLEPCMTVITAAAFDALTLDLDEAMSAAARRRPAAPGTEGRGPRGQAELTTGLPLERVSLYSPEMNLIAETDAAASGTTPVIAHEYVWFAGMPVAQVDHSTSTTSWTFTDHLGTPVLQTDASGLTTWRVEYEPYGTVYEVRVGEERHQPLRFPGQEAQLVESGGLGVGERAYNIYRWYRSGWGKYSQVDPITFATTAGASVAEWTLFQAGSIEHQLKINPARQHPFAYGLLNPVREKDLDGRFVSPACARRWAGPAIDRAREIGEAEGLAFEPQNALQHCFWSCLMKRFCYDPLTSFAAGMWNEVLGLVRTTAASRERDIHNNREGRECAEPPCGCEPCCVGKFRSGELQRGPS